MNRLKHKCGYGLMVGLNTLLCAVQTYQPCFMVVIQRLHTSFQRKFTPLHCTCCKAKQIKLCSMGLFWHGTVLLGLSRSQRKGPVWSNESEERGQANLKACSCLLTCTQIQQIRNTLIQGLKSHWLFDAGSSLLLVSAKSHCVTQKVY